MNYSNTTSYAKIAEQIVLAMGKLVFQIFIPENETDFFIIPDFSAGTARERINEYFNPDVKEIAYISLPLDSKIYIRFYSEKFFKNSQVPDSVIMYCPSSFVSELNKINLDYCQDKIACEDEKYLKSFINNNI